jgi:hypothetical protein
MMAAKALDVGQNLATQRVIGYTRSVTRTKGKKNPKVIQENLNVGIQAWELGILIAAAGAYYYLTGDKISDIALNTLPPIGNMQSNGTLGNLSQPTGVRIV